MTDGVAICCWCYAYSSTYKEFCWYLKLLEMYQRAAFILRRYVEFGVGMD